MSVRDRMSLTNLGKFHFKILRCRTTLYTLQRLICLARSETGIQFNLILRTNLIVLFCKICNFCRKISEDHHTMQSRHNQNNSAISLPSRDWFRSTPRYRTDVLAVTSVSPHVTFISDLVRSLLLVPSAFKYSSYILSSLNGLRNYYRPTIHSAKRVH